MLTNILLSFAVVSIAFLLMGVGVLIGKTRIKGSCKGDPSGDGGCEVCSNDTDQCVRKESPFMRPLKAFLKKSEDSSG